jgi:kynurenine formamidase
MLFAKEELQLPETPSTDRLDVARGGRYRQRPPGSTWGDFGEQDQLGRVNLIDRSKVLQAVAEVRTGQNFCLSLPLDLPGSNILNPRRYPPQLSPTVRQGVPNWVYETRREVERATDVINDDRVNLWLQYSTQWDSFAHVGALFDANADGIDEPVFYNGYRAEQAFSLRAQGSGDPAPRPGFEQVSKAHALGVEHLARHGMQGRGVLVDLRRPLGDARTVVGYDLFCALLDKQAVVLEEADMLCIYTGFSQVLLEWGGAPDANRIHQMCAAFDGRDERLLQLLSDTRISALIADNYAIEHLAADPAFGAGAATGCAVLPLHQHCLFKLGVPLGELWYLHELAEELHLQQRNRFLLTAPPLRLPGAVGSPVTPIATL